MSKTSGTAQLADEQLTGIVARSSSSVTAKGAARDALGQLYQRHARALLAYLAARLGREVIDDIHHDVWVRALDAIQAGEYSQGNFRGWLFQIARNLVIDFQRRKRPESLAEAEALPDRRNNRPDEPLIEQERKIILEECLEKLAGRGAQVVRSKLGGEGYPEICRRLGLSHQAAYKAFHTAMKQLKQCVERAQT